MNIDWDGKSLPPVGVTCERRFDALEDSSWQREKDAEELAFIATGHRDRSKDCWISLAKVLLDAGYRKFEIVEEDV